LQDEEHAEFLKSQPSFKWQHLLQTFQIDAAQFENQARAAKVPFVAVLLPNRAQAAMLSSGTFPDGYDPYILNNKLRDIIVSHGGIYVDILPDFRKITDAEQYYFPVDGHLDADGHAMISRLLAKELTGGTVPALRAASLPETSSAVGR
jgi:hypothetical protein